MTDAADQHDVGHDPDARMAESLEHLQRAAREMIAASRAALDVAERLVDDPDTIGRIGAAIGSAAARARHAGPRRDGHGGADDNTVERIRVD